jgi:hypothetical protein
VRIFTASASGNPQTTIVRTLDAEKVPGSVRSAKGWSPATVRRILDNEEYVGRWVWNRTEIRRDPRTERRRERLLAGPGQPAGALPHSPAVRKHDVRVLRCRDRTDQRQKRRLLGLPCRHERRVREQDARSPHTRREGHPRSGPGTDLRPGAPCIRPASGSRRRSPSCGRIHTLKLKEAELAAEQRRLANFVDFIGEGRGSQALARRCSKRSDGSTQALRNMLGTDPSEARYAGPRSALLPRGHVSRRSRLNRIALRMCGGRFECFAKVETAGIEPASAVA